ncbi:MAG: LysE family transporter [Sedimentisphaerales bacterium]|nr:LysE family transporter [Sedimentisphaerales bacterium]
MNIFIFLLQVFVISISGVLAPGPVTAATIAAGTKSRHAGFLISIGHCAVELPLMVAAMLGLGFIMGSGMANMLIGLIGGVFLVYMGLDMLRDVKNFHADQPYPKTAGPIKTGMILSITNPYFILWWATVGLNFAKDAANLGHTVLILFALVHWFCDMTWLEIMSLASFKGMKLLGENKQKVILAICSLAIIAFGVFFVIKSFLPPENIT